MHLEVVVGVAHEDDGLAVDLGDGAEGDGQRSSDDGAALGLPKDANPRSGGYSCSLRATDPSAARAS